MSLLSATLCLKCEEIYDLDNRKVCIGTCNHSICETCFDQKLSDSCPICETGDAFKTKHMNYQAQGLLRELGGSFPLDTLFNEMYERQNTGEGACAECHYNSEKLRVCVDCSTQSGLLILSDDGTLRLSTNTADELLVTKILRIQNVSICTSCVVDRAKHEGHRLVLLSRVEGMEDALRSLHSRLGKDD